MKWRWLAAAGLLVSAFAYSQNYPVGELLLLSHVPGIYRSDIWLRVEVSDDESSLEMRFSGTDYFLPLRRPLHLTSIPGEERRYDLELRVQQDGRVRESRQVSFTIDKRAPVPPRPSADSGVYVDSVAIRVNSSSDSTVEYTLDRPLTFEPVQWPGSVLVLEATSGAREVTFRARAVDAAGNRSREVVREYTIVPARSVQTELEVLSPVPGEYANPQLLFIEAPPQWSLVYSFGEVDPTDGGQRYDGPLLLSGSGERRLRVAARDEKGDWHRREVVFSQGTTDLLGVDSGAYDRRVQIPQPAVQGLRYSLNGESPRPFQEALSLSPQPGVFRPTVLSIEDAEGNRYRYVFLLEGRDPGTPDVEITQTGTEAVLIASARPGARIRYELNGTEGVFAGPVTIPLPEETAEGELTVVARAVLSSGVSGPPVRRTLVFDTSSPPAPTLDLSPVATGMRISYRSPPGTVVVYELGDRKVSAESPRLVSGSIVEAPFAATLETRVSARALDSAGNLSQSATVEPILIDRLPPPTPIISQEGRVISLDGEGTLLYQVQPPIGVPVGSSEAGFLAYDGPFELSGEANRRIEYRITALAVDDAENASPVTERVVVVNRRTPVVPPLAGIVDGGVYNLPVLTVAFRDSDPDLELYYTVSDDGESPSDPTVEDTRYTGPFQLQGRSGEEVEFVIKVLPHYPATERTGAVRTFRIVLDQEAPELPMIRGVSPGEVTTTSPLVELVPADPGDTVFFATGDAASAPVDALGSAGRIYSNPFEIAAPNGAEREVLLDVAVRDRAGNINRLDEPMRFIVDRRPPEPPSLRILYPDGEGLSFGSEVRLALESEETVYYETTSDGRIPPVPGRASNRFERDIVLPGIEGAVVQYNIAAVAVDRAGNRSEIVEVLGLTVDREPPPEAPEPTVRSLGDGRSAHVAWELPVDATLFYRVDEESEFEEYEGVVEILLPEADEALVLAYYLVDEAGNRGPVRETELSVAGKPAPPSLVGVESGGLYGTAVTIVESVDTGVVRYEVAESPSLPAPITRFSPSLTESLRIDVAEDRTVGYELRARRFVGSRVSDPVSFSFTIDRTPPEPPILAGVESGGYYENEQSVTLSADEGRIYVAVRRNAAASSVSMDDEPSFQEYAGPIRLGAEEGDLASYTVFAYTEDAAGNRSEPTVSWQIFIDREIIYVAPAGDDTGDGSRGSPFATIDRAVEYARRSERSTIFLAEGAYEVSEPIVVEETLSLVGGYDPETWQRRAAARSVLRRSARSSDTRAMFLVGEGRTLNASGLEIVEAKGFWQSIVESTAGSVSIADSRFVLSGRTVPITSTEGSLRITGSQFDMTRTAAAVVISVSRGSVELRGIGIQLADLVSSFDGVRLLDADAAIRDTTFSGRDGWMIRGIAATGGSLEIVDLAVEIAGAREGATGVSVTEGVVSASGLDVSIADSPYALAFRLEGGGAELTRSSLVVSNVQGGTGIVVRDGSATVRQSKVKLSGASQFAYGLSGGNSELRFSATAVSADARGEAFLAVVEDSSLRIEHLSGRIVGAPRIAGGINAGGDGEISVANSILIGPGTGIAVAAASRDGGVSASSLSGWSTVLVRPEREAALNDVEALNRHYRDLVILGRIDSFTPNVAFGVGELFDEFPRLEPGAPVIDSGVDLGGPPILDIDGQPIPRDGTRPDIGADEYYPAGS